MDSLLAKLNDFEKLVGNKLVYNLADGTTIKVTFKEEHFLHLLGLHKLLDIRIIYDWRDKNNSKIKNKEIIRAIKSGTITDKIIKSSSFYYAIKDRYNSFNFTNISSLAYTDAIIDFDAKIIPSKLLCNYILFEKDTSNEYNHMSIGTNIKTKEMFLESFFHEKTDKYIQGQKIIQVKNYMMLDKLGNVIFEDNFIK